MAQRGRQEPDWSRTALLPGVLAAIVLLAGLALIGEDWYTAVRYVTSILAIIVCVFAVQARQWWWLIGLVPIAVVWNPVWPITLTDLTLRLAHIVAAAVFIVCGLVLKVPVPDDRR